MDNIIEGNDINVSVIIPVYNAENFLEKCLDSVLKQTYRKFEVVLVNDGSEDRSVAICEKFANRDNRIKLIHKQNEGLICARLTGIEAAKGELLAFVDADDWVEASFLACLVNMMESAEADIVIGGCIYEDDGKAVYETNKIASGIYEGKHLTKVVYPRMLHYQDFNQFGILPFVWNKLFRKKILEKCYDNIDTKIYDGEDVAVVFPYLLYSQKVVIIDECLNHYRIHENSMTFSKGESYYENVSRLYLYLNGLFKKSGYYDIMLPQLNQYMRMMIWQGNPKGFIGAEQIYFPFHSVPGGSDIIIYGAGYLGKIYYHQLKKTNYCNVISWVDKNYYNIFDTERVIECPTVIPLKKYDYVIIAVINKEMQEEIRESLCKYGVYKRKIICGAI